MITLQTNSYTIQPDPLDCDGKISEYSLVRKISPLMKFEPVLIGANPTAYQWTT